MKMYNKYLSFNIMTRSGEKIEKLEKIYVYLANVHNVSAIAYRNYLESLNAQTTTYDSVHYIIGIYGEVICCIPEGEISWHSKDFTIDKTSIGIKLCNIDKEHNITNITRQSLIKLLDKLCEKYHLDPKTDIYYQSEKIKK